MPKLWFLSLIPPQWIFVSCSWWRNTLKLRFLFQNSMSTSSFSWWLLTIQKLKFFNFVSFSWWLLTIQSLLYAEKVEEDTKALIFISNKFVFFDFYLQKALIFIYKKPLGLYLYHWVTFFFFTTQKLKFFWVSWLYIFFPFNTSWSYLNGL